MITIIIFSIVGFIVSLIFARRNSPAGLFIVIATAFSAMFGVIAAMCIQQHYETQIVKFDILETNGCYATHYSTKNGNVFSVFIHYDNFVCESTMYSTDTKIEFSSGQPTLEILKSVAPDNFENRFSIQNAPENKFILHIPEGSIRNNLGTHGQ